MAIADESEFLDSYVKLMGAAWTDKEAAQRLTADPAEFARQAGLPVEAGAVVELDRSTPEGLFAKEVLIEDWTARPGVHVLHVPATPLVNTGELSEAELEQVAGGIVIIIACKVG